MPAGVRPGPSDRSRAALLLGAALVLATSHLAAQQAPIPLDTVRVTVASRSGQLLNATTRALTVLDRESLLNSPATTLVEALEWGFGIELMPRSPALADVGIRGSSFEQVLVLVDGVRMRDAQTGHFNLNLTVPLEQVERVEVLRGPAASLFGSDAMGGVVNIVTRRGADATAASLTAGSFDRRSLSASRRQHLGALAFDGAVSIDRSDGHRIGTDYDMRSGRLAVQIPLSGLNVLNAEVAHAVRKFGAGGFYGNYPSFETTRTTTAIASAGLNAGGVRIEPAVRLRKNTDDFVLYRDEPARYRNQHSTLHLGADLIGRAPLGSAVQVAGGLHAYRDEVRSAALGDHTEHTTAVSLELSTDQPTGLAATVGLRADRVPSGSTQLNPSASIAWPVHEIVRLRGSIGRAFRSPTWTERFYRDPVNEGTPDLSPERAWSVDAGVDVQPVPALRLSASAFIREAEDLIDWARPLADAQQIWRTRNVHEARFRGAELEMELADLAGVRLRGTGYWLSVRSSAATGFESKYALRPRVESAVLTADRSFGKLDLLVRGTRERRSGEERFFTVGGRAAFRVQDVRLFVDVRNATDAAYLDISQIPAAGRNVTVGLELRPF